MTVTTDTISAITTHHRHLQTALTERVEAILAATRGGKPHLPAVVELRAFLADELEPHARAEEDVLYAAAVTSPTLTPLVAGMIFEHETLLGLSRELASTPSAVDTAGVARAIREVFVGHVRRENELLLPALAGHPTVDLAALLPVMEERFAAYRAGAAVTTG